MRVDMMNNLDKMVVAVPFILRVVILRISLVISLEMEISLDLRTCLVEVQVLEHQEVADPEGLNLVDLEVVDTLILEQEAVRDRNKICMVDIISMNHKKKRNQNQRECMLIWRI